MAMEAVFEFPAASVNLSALTEIDPEPVCVLEVGVNRTV